MNKKQKSVGNINKYNVFVMGKLNEKTLTEFLNNPSLDKFDSRSEEFFKDGINMGYWFGLNMDRIILSENKLCVEIKKQYELKKKRDKSRNIIFKRKYKYEFYALKDLNKFNRNNDLTFKDGSKIGKWLKENKRDILLSDALIDKHIKKQYENYLKFKRLELEFLNAPIDKFSQYKCVKFMSGAIMNFWWECNMDIILSSTDEISNNIRTQYEKYCSSYGKNNDQKEAFIKKL